MNSALNRQVLRNYFDRTECVACGGSGKKSRPAPGKSPECIACDGIGSIQVESNMADQFTHPLYLDLVREWMGGIDLDPASCEEAQSNVQASAWYGEGSPFGENGLEEPAMGKVFLHPPGGKPSKEYRQVTESSTVLWWMKYIMAWQDDEVEQMVFLCPTIEVLRSAQNVHDLLQPIQFPFCIPRERMLVLKDGVEKKCSTPGVIILVPPKEDYDRWIAGEGGLNNLVEVFSKIGECRV